MRAVVQRVSSASVKINGIIHGEIGNGLLILLGIEEEDQIEDITWLTQKISKMRIFSDAEGLMNLSILDTKGEALIISQFTLFASTKKGNRPSYIKAAKPQISEPLYEKFVEEFEQKIGKKTATGQFGADMKVSLVNDGPVTIIIDSKNKE